MQHMDANGRKWISIPFDDIATLVSAHVTCERIAEEVRKALETDVDLRILIHEAVRECMSKINFIEIVESSVKNALEQAGFPSHTHTKQGTEGEAP